MNAISAMASTTAPGKSRPEMGGYAGLAGGGAAAYGTYSLLSIERMSRIAEPVRLGATIAAGVAGFAAGMLGYLALTQPRPA